jgi:hypothetical protein
MTDHSAEDASYSTRDVPGQSVDGKQHTGQKRMCALPLTQSIGESRDQLGKSKLTEMAMLTACHIVS